MVSTPAAAGDHRDLQSSACFLIGWLKRLSIATFPRPTRRQECDLGHRRHGVLEDLEALRIDFGVIEADPGDIPAGARQAGNEPNPDCINPDPNDRYCAGGRADRQRDGIGLGNDYVRAATDDLASEIGKALGPPLAGIPLDCKILSLDIAQPAQLSEKTLVEAEPYEVATGFADDGDGTCGDDDRNPALLPPLLRLDRSDCGREQQTNCEIAPPHSMISSAPASSVGGMVRPSAVAAFRLMRNSNFVGRNSEIKIEAILSSANRCERVAIFGLGGAGKTQIALEFAYRLRDTQLDYAVFWIPLTNIETMLEAYQEIARQLRILVVEQENAEV